MHCLFMVTNNMSLTVLLFRQTLVVCLELAFTHTCMKVLNFNLVELACIPIEYEECVH